MQYMYISKLPSEPRTVYTELQNTAAIKNGEKGEADYAQI